MGNIFTNGNISCTDCIIDAAKATQNGSAPFAGSLMDSAAISAFSNYKTYLGAYTDTNGTWYNIISIRHKNGAGDGNSYGMYLRAPLTSFGNLTWNQQTGTNTWQTERTLLDSNNYKTWCTPSNIGAAASSHTHTKSQITDFGHNHKYESLNPESIELGSGATNYGGYIDFHFNASPVDYTTRLIELSSGTLTVVGSLNITEGLILTADKTCGSTLPSSGVINQVFFKIV